MHTLVAGNSGRHCAIQKSEREREEASAADPRQRQDGGVRERLVVEERREEKHREIGDVVFIYTQFSKVVIARTTRITSARTKAENHSKRSRNSIT